MGTVLVVDDEDLIRHVLRAALEKAGHEVVEAHNGAAALHVYRSQSIDVVITDILMPGSEGLGCILELRQIDPGVRVIAISGGSSYNSVDVLDLARRFGARRTFWKPFAMDRLLRAVKEEMAGRRAA